MKLLHISLISLLTVGATACIEDSFTSSPSAQPTFSIDTLKMGDAFTLEGTPTKRFTVYNNNDKGISISNIALRDDPDGYFRINVDGLSGRNFTNVDIRPNDSIFVFVEATLPENNADAPVNLLRHLDFTTNGVTSTVVIDINGQDAVRLTDETITSDRTLTANRPYIVYGKLNVQPGVTLTLEPGTTLRFHDKAEMIVEGTLVSNGTPEKPVQMYGDRDGFVAAQIPYELMSGQWGGVYFTETSSANRITATSIRNSNYGIVLDNCVDNSAPALTMINSQVRNTTDRTLTAIHTSTLLVGCELTDASNGPMLLVGGNHRINHCTIANYYLFTALGAPSIDLSHVDSESADDSGLPFTSADFTNCIVYGNGTLLSHGDLTGTAVTFRRCLLGVNGTDDDNFINCLWDEDPLFYTVRNEYLFDYRLKPDSPAIGAADPSLDIFNFDTDRYGVPTPNPAPLGCYNFTPPAE